MMLDERFDREVHEWGEYEVLYKELYEKKQEGDEVYRQYLRTLDREELQEQWFNIPDLFEPVTNFSEEIPIFRIDGSVTVWKHARYTPPTMHAHDYFEIICVMEGKAYNRIENNPIMEMIPGDICILPDRTRHSMEVMSDDGIVINIMIKKSTFREVFFEVFMGDNILSKFFWDALHGDLENAYLFFRTGQNHPISNTIKHVFMEFLEKNRYYEQIVRSDILCLFAYLMRGFEEYCTQNNEKSFELELLKYIKQNYAVCTLDSVAEHFSYNSSYVSRIIKQSTGETFSNLMKQYRMNMACRLLTESDLQIALICEEVGYKSVAHFNHIFKKEFGMSPTEYRIVKNAE